MAASSGVNMNFVDDDDNHWGEMNGSLMNNNFNGGNDAGNIGNSDNG